MTQNENTDKKGPTYGSPTSTKIFRMHNCGKFRGNTNPIPLDKSPSYPGSGLTRVYCFFDKKQVNVNIHTIFAMNILRTLKSCI